MNVWIAEYVDYEQSHVVGVYANPELAVDSIKSAYPSPPYIVSWDAPRMEADEWELQGRFARVEGHSTEHVGCWSITRHEVHDRRRDAGTRADSNKHLGPPHLAGA